MKKLLIAASALFVLAGAAQAQNAQPDTAKVRKHHRGGEFARTKGARPMQKLNLSEEQKKQFKEQGENFRKQAAELRKSNLGAEEKKTKLQALRKEQFEKTQSIFTAEQKAQLAAGRKAAGERGFRKDGKGFDRAKGMEQMKTRLGLTDEQSAKLKTSQQGFREKMKTIHGDDKLSKEQKKEQVKALAKEQRESMKSILTPEQLEKMKAGRKNKGGSK